MLGADLGRATRSQLATATETEHQSGSRQSIVSAREFIRAGHPSLQDSARPRPQRVSSDGERCMELRWRVRVCHTSFSSVSSSTSSLSSSDVSDADCTVESVDAPAPPPTPTPPPPPPPPAVVVVVNVMFRLMRRWYQGCDEMDAGRIDDK